MRDASTDEERVLFLGAGTIGAGTAGQIAKDVDDSFDAGHHRGALPERPQDGVLDGRGGLLQPVGHIGHKTVHALDLPCGQAS